MKGVIEMSKKSKNKPKSFYETYQSIRRGWNGIDPRTKVIEDKRDKQERKYPKKIFDMET